MTSKAGVILSDIGTQPWCWNDSSIVSKQSVISILLYSIPRMYIIFSFLRFFCITRTLYCRRTEIYMTRVRCPSRYIEPKRSKRKRSNLRLRRAKLLLNNNTALGFLYVSLFAKAYQTGSIFKNKLYILLTLEDIVINIHLKLYVAIIAQRLNFEF